jgi:hypothetical protein
MKTIFKISFVFSIFCLPAFSQAQVVLKDLLKQDHNGKVDKSVNYSGKTLYYSWHYDSTDPVPIRSNYALKIGSDQALKNAISIPVVIRDITTETYVEAYLNNGSETKTFTVIYNKDERWYRIKCAPQWGCRRGEDWKRVDGINNLDDLLNSVVMQMDNNLKLNCYSGMKSDMAKSK